LLSHYGHYQLLKRLQGTNTTEHEGQERSDWPCGGITMQGSAYMDKLKHVPTCFQIRVMGSVLVCTCQTWYSILIDHHQMDKNKYMKWLYVFIYFNPSDDGLSRSKHKVVWYKHKTLVLTLLSVLFYFKLLCRRSPYTVILQCSGLQRTCRASCPIVPSWLLGCAWAKIGEESLKLC
jgi:hypothetical protein